jgi:predicted kinase
MIVLMAGLPGTGKTTLAHKLAERTGGRVIGKDEVRHALFTEHEIEYSSRQDDFCMQIMLQTAEYLLSRDEDRFIFLDGRPFSRCYQIENVIQAADSMRQHWRILECVCSEETAQQRLQEQNAQREHLAANRTFELYLAVKARFETIAFPKTIIDTTAPLEIGMQQALLALR